MGDIASGATGPVAPLLDQSEDDGGLPIMPPQQPVPIPGATGASGATGPVIQPAPPIIRLVWPLQSDMIQFYGDPAGANWLHANTIDVRCPWPLFMGNTPLQNILIHRRCAESLTRVLNNIWDAVGHDLSKIHELRYDQYSGSYNYRPMRGGYALSCHAYAAAIDWDDQDNQQHSQHHLFTDDSLLVREFKAEGWVWGGDWSAASIDAMHVQAARVR